VFGQEFAMPATDQPLAVDDSIEFADENYECNVLTTPGVPESAEEAARVIEAWERSL